MNDRQFEECMGRICRNDREGLRAVYEEYCPMVYSVVYEILHNREDAEDVASEFFIRLWDIADTYRPGNGHRAWLITIAHNLAIDYVRKHRREDLSAEIPDHLQKGESFPEDQLCQKLSLEQALKTLKEEERQIVNLKIMGELTFREIASLLRKPQGTVAWCYRTAIRKLREVQL